MEDVDLSVTPNNGLFDNMPVSSFLGVRVNDSEELPYVRRLGSNSVRLVAQEVVPNPTYSVLPLLTEAKARGFRTKVVFKPNRMLDWETTGAYLSQIVPYTDVLEIENEVDFNWQVYPDSTSQIKSDNQDPHLKVANFAEYVPVVIDQAERIKPGILKLVSSLREPAKYANLLYSSINRIISSPLNPASVHAAFHAYNNVQEVLDSMATTSAASGLPLHGTEIGVEVRPGDQGQQNRHQIESTRMLTAAKLLGAVDVDYHQMSDELGNDKNLFGLRWPNSSTLYTSFALIQAWVVLERKGALPIPAEVAALGLR